MDDKQYQLIVAEFTALRNEILERTKFQHQLVSLNIVAAGAFLGIAVKSDVSPAVFLMLAVLITLLAVAWAVHDLNIARLGAYIKHRYEKETVLAWEHFIDSPQSKGWKEPFWLSIYFHARWIFICTQLLIMVGIALAIPLNEFGMREIILISADFVVILLTYFIVQPSRM